MCVCARACVCAVCVCGVCAYIRVCAHIVCVCVFLVMVPHFLNLSSETRVETPWEFVCTWLCMWYYGVKLGSLASQFPYLITS